MFCKLRVGGAQVAEDMGGGRPTVLQGCGHLSHEETPAALLEALTAFVTRCLAEVPGAPPSGASSAAALSRTASGMSAGRGVCAVGDDATASAVGGGKGASAPPSVVNSARSSAAVVGSAPDLQYSGG